MDISIFVASLFFAAIGPLLAIRYLRPILERVLLTLCDSDGGAEFWIRSAYLLATTGTLQLALVFGNFDPGTSVVDALRRVMLLTLAGVFATVAIISSKVWKQVQRWLLKSQAVNEASKDPSLNTTAP